MSRSYWGVVLENHTHNNPVAYCFIATLTKAASDRKSASATEEPEDAENAKESLKQSDAIQLTVDSAETNKQTEHPLPTSTESATSETEPVPPRSLGVQRTVTKIWLALLLHHNPSLCKYRKAFLQRVEAKLEVSIKCA